MGVVALEERAAIGARFDPLEAAYLDDPYPYLTEAREAAPVFYAESVDHWIVTRHRDIKQIFRDPPTFSAVNANAPLRPPCPMAAKALEEGGWGAVPTLANVDPPAHTRVRRIANIAFTPKRVAEMEAFVRELTVRFCSERLRDGRADLVRDLAWELPVLVLFRILGVDAHEVSRVKEGSWNRILFIYGRPSEVEQVKAAEGMARFWSLADQLVADRTAAPRDDFVSTLVHTPDVEGKTLTRQQAATVVLNLLFAGHETTTGLIGNMFNRLLADRQAWSDILAEPALIRNAVEEILRLDSSVIAWRRRTTRAAEIGGIPVPAGANLLMMLGAANRDPEVFADPDRLDIRRANAREHLSFGSGPHLCFPRLAERLDNGGAQLSGGEQQMLAIGRALMTNPALLVLDEATEGLAPIVREEIWRRLHELKRTGLAILIIDKELDELCALADRHYVIEKGEVVWSGDTAALQADARVQANYLAL